MALQYQQKRMAYLKASQIFIVSFLPFRGDTTFDLFQSFKGFWITFDWLKKSFDRKLAPIEVIM